MKDMVDVAIVGAGPYGLSVAAHLRGTGRSCRQFGLSMNLWSTAMPRGMYLKSQGFASNLSDPQASVTLKAFCAATAREYGDYGVPVPLDTFVAYGQEFRRSFAPELAEVLVTDVRRDGDRYRVTAADGTELAARNVVVATGVEHFAHVPDVLADLPPDRCTHASAHDDLGVFAGRTVVVLGAGQSALESAALLHEQGADVSIVARAADVAWNGVPLALDRSLPERLREPEAGLGSGWATWFYSTQPRLYRRLPAGTRISRARTALGPAGASWLRSRVEGRFPVLTGHIVDWAKPDGDGVHLGLRTLRGSTVELRADHVLAGTGYRPDVSRLSFLDSHLSGRLATVAGTPQVGPDFDSSAPGLYFVGPAVAPTFGPVMRFVYGADFAARAVARGISRTAVRRAVAVGSYG